MTDNVQARVYMSPANHYPQLAIAKEIAREHFARDKEGLIASLDMLVWSETNNTVRKVTFTREGLKRDMITKGEA